MSETSPERKPAVDTGFFELPHKFNFSNQEMPPDLSVRGLSPENDAWLDKLDAWDRFYAESDRMDYIDPDGTVHYS